MKSRPRALLQGLRAAACVVIAGCFEDPPPVEQGTSDGSATGGSTTAAATGTSSGPMPSTSGEIGSGEIGSGEIGSGTVADASTTLAEVVCGDGVVDAGEMCDSTPGCDAMCRFTDYACNPLNDAGCEPPQRCGLFDFATETFACMPAGPAGMGEVCGRAEANDGDCGADLTCIFNTKTVLCAVGNCCVGYCDALAGTGCADFEICAQFFPMPTHEGLEHLGFCYSR